MAFLLSIAISAADDDGLLLVEANGRQILVGSISDAGAHIGAPRLLDSKDHVPADPYPADLVADDLPVLQGSRLVGAGWASLCHAVVTAVAESGIATDTVSSLVVDDVLQLDFQVAAAAPTQPSAQATPTAGVPATTQATTPTTVTKGPRPGEPGSAVTLVPTPGASNRPAQTLDTRFALMASPVHSNLPHIVLVPMENGLPPMTLGCLVSPPDTVLLDKVNHAIVGAPLKPFPANLLNANVFWKGSPAPLGPSFRTPAVLDKIRQEIARFLNIVVDQVDLDTSTIATWGAPAVRVISQSLGGASGGSASTPTATPAPATASSPAAPAAAHPATQTLPTQTTASNMPAIDAAMMQGNPLSVSYALMETPDAFGKMKLVLAPWLASHQGFPAVLIGSYDPQTGVGQLCQFSALPAGIPLTPTLLPPSLILPASQLQIDQDTLRDVLDNDLADLLGSDFDGIEHDPVTSQTLGTEIFNVEVIASGTSTSARGLQGSQPGQAQPGQAQQAQPHADSTLPAEAPVRDLAEVTAALAKAADANPDIAAKLKGIEGLNAEVQAKMTPETRVKKPETFFSGGWS